jgi:hypothetical protein
MLKGFEELLNELSDKSIDVELRMVHQEPYESYKAEVEKQN